MVNLWGLAAFGAARPAAVRPTYTPDNAPGDADDWAKDCSSPTARDGTELKAAFVNMLLAQLRQVVRRSSVTVTNLDDDLLAKALASGNTTYAVATGTANAWTVAPALAVPAYAAGRVLNIVAPATNTSTTVNMAVSGLANRRIKKQDGTDPAAGDLVSGKIYATIDDGTNIRVLTPLPSDMVADTALVARTQIFTASGTFNIPTGVVSAEVQCWGGGGGGGASGTGGNGGGGGSAGGYSYKRVTGLTPGGTVTVTVGAAGTSGASANGGAGGTSSFGAHCSSTGGGGGLTGNNIYSGSGAGGAGAGGDLNIPGGQGGPSGPGAGAAFDPAFIYNLASRGGLPAFGAGVVSWFGSGAAGTGYASGGTGATGGSGLAGGAGAAGLVIVKW